MLQFETCSPDDVELFDCLIRLKLAAICRIRPLTWMRMTRNSQRRLHQSDALLLTLTKSRHAVDLFTFITIFTDAKLAVVVVVSPG